MLPSTPAVALDTPGQGRFSGLSPSVFCLPLVCTWASLGPRCKRQRPTGACRPSHCPCPTRPGRLGGPRPGGVGPGCLPSSSPRRHGTGRRRDSSGAERGRLDSGKRLRALPGGPPLDHEHRRHWGHPQAGGRLLRILLGPPGTVGPVVTTGTRSARSTRRPRRSAHQTIPPRLPGAPASAGTAGCP